MPMQNVNWPLSQCLPPTRCYRTVCFHSMNGVMTNEKLRKEGASFSIAHSLQLTQQHRRCLLWSASIDRPKLHSPPASVLAIDVGLLVGKAACQHSSKNSYMQQMLCLCLNAATKYSSTGYTEKWILYETCVSKA